MPVVHLKELLSEARALGCTGDVGQASNIVRTADERDVTDDLTLLLRDDEALGRSAAAMILASDAAVAAAMYLLRSEPAASVQP